MNKNDYIFFKYCSLYMDDIFLNKIIEKHERGLSILEKKKIYDFIVQQDKIGDIKKALFIYVLFKRTKQNNYVDELAKRLYKDFTNKTQKDLWEYYLWTQTILDNMGLPELKVSKQVNKNIKFFYE